MKKIKNNLLLLYSFIILSYGAYSYYQNYDKNNISDLISSGSTISFTGTTFTGSTNGTGTITNTGITIEETKTELQKFQGMQIDGFVRKFNPPAQPYLTSKQSYQEKSNILNKYLQDNNFYFRNTSKLEDGYLYLKLAKPIGNYDIFLYFHDSSINGYPMSGKIAKEKNLITGTGANQEFLFKLDAIAITKFYDNQKIDFDWLNTTLSDTNRIHFIGGYTTTSDGNQIQEIIITGK